MSLLSRSLILLALSAACALAEPQFWSPAGVPVVPVVPVVLPAALGTVGVSQTQVIGDCKSDDRLLQVQTVRKSAKWMQVRSEVVSYPAEGQPGGLISCIRLECLKTDNVGSAIVQKGGPGQRQVDVKVKSDRGHSVAWNVIVYGKPGPARK